MDERTIRKIAEETVEANSAAQQGYLRGAGTQAFRPRTDPEIIEELFNYHDLDDLQRNQVLSIREAAKYLALVILQNTPKGADRTAAIRKLRECVMTANQ